MLESGEQHYIKAINININFFFFFFFNTSNIERTNAPKVFDVCMHAYFIFHWCTDRFCRFDLRNGLHMRNYLLMTMCERPDLID